MSFKASSCPSRLSGPATIALAGILSSAVIGSGPAGYGQSSSAAPGSIPADRVVATVDGDEIKAGEIESSLTAALAGRTVSNEMLPTLRAEVLAQLIDQRLVEEALGKNYRASAEEVDKSIAESSEQLEAAGSSFKEFLADRRLDMPTFRRQRAWQLSWQRYVGDRLTDQLLKSYFASHKREFDGTQLRVRHILLQLEGGDPKETARLLGEAKGLREQIETGKLTFAKAAELHSAGPSRYAGGDLGFIPRRGVMVEPFAKAAFSLRKGQVSEPVVTTFGVHLIEVSEEKPGERDWTDVRELLIPPASDALFARLAAEGRKKAKIAFTGAMPYFHPGTRELIANAAGN